MSLSTSSSEDENDDSFEVTDVLAMDWVKFLSLDLSQHVALGDLPGQKYKAKKRSLKKDLAVLQVAGITDVFCLCTDSELTRYKVPGLLVAYQDLGLRVHRYPCLDGLPPTMVSAMEVVRDLQDCITSGRTSYIHCYGGMGRACVVVACLAMSLDESLSSTEVIQSLRDLRGPRAIQTVKQYNFVNDFRAEKLRLEGGNGAYVAAATS